MKTVGNLEFLQCQILMEIPRAVLNNTTVKEAKGTIPLIGGGFKRSVCTYNLVKETY